MVQCCEEGGEIAVNTGLPVRRRNSMQRRGNVQGVTVGECCRIQGDELPDFLQAVLNGIAMDVQ